MYIIYHKAKFTLSDTPLPDGAKVVGECGLHTEVHTNKCVYVAMAAMEFLHEGTGIGLMVENDFGVSQHARHANLVFHQPMLYEHFCNTYLDKLIKKYVHVPQLHFRF